ncbi:hypothetical protein M0802_006924 [Mischocyttarus mexicanus]|nr:hypothetical protein M0802_006924 [Mischocyttarus mexicanus]
MNIKSTLWVLMERGVVVVVVDTLSKVRNTFEPDRVLLASEISQIPADEDSRGQRRRAHPRGVLASPTER